MLQAQRLGAHFSNPATSIGPITHIFASDLQRASKTAEAIAQGQKETSSEPELTLAVEKFAELRERDFRSAEGQKFGTRSKDGNADPYADAETKEEMRARIDRFLDSTLRDIIDKAVANDMTQSVVIVAHGLILNVLLKALLARYPSSEQWRNSSDYTASWSNTGYLEAQLAGGLSSIEAASSTKYHMSVIRVNCVDHLQGIRKTRGGIGSAKFDDKQKTMDSFFTRVAKKRKSDDQADAT